MIQWIDGKKLAETKRKTIKKTITELSKGQVAPCLAVVLVGNDPASQIYVNNKEKACAEVGIKSHKLLLDENISEKELLDIIEELNHNTVVNGILVQLPLPKHISEKKIIDAILPEKDVDGFSPINMGNLILGKEGLRPCTPAGCIELLHDAGCSIEGKHAVVLGRSNIVGKPVAAMLTKENATVTICHSKTKNLSAILQSADIIIAAIGKAGFVQSSMVKDGTYVIDVGINRLSDGTVCGDVDQKAFEKENRNVYITPVPGGVGPMTITMLLENTLQAYKQQMRKKYESK